MVCELIVESLPDRAASRGPQQAHCSTEFSISNLPFAIAPISLIVESTILTGCGAARSRLEA